MTNTTQALKVIENYVEREYGEVGLLEQLQYVDETYDEAGQGVQAAYRIVMAGYKKLFLG